MPPSSYSCFLLCFLYHLLHLTSSIVCYDCFIVYHDGGLGIYDQEGLLLERCPTAECRESHVCGSANATLRTQDDDILLTEFYIEEDSVLLNGCRHPRNNLCLEIGNTVNCRVDWCDESHCNRPPSSLKVDSVHEDHHSSTGQKQATKHAERLLLLMIALAMMLLFGVILGAVVSRVFCPVKFQTSKMSRPV